MATLIPTASSCHNLQLPPTEKDDRLNLNVRTGSASSLYNSLVFVHGGLTIGLELSDKLSIPDIIGNFVLKVHGSKSRRIEKYLSSELFVLSLIERTWTRVKTDAGAQRPRARMFHEVCVVNNCAYIFGGLVVRDEYAEDAAAYARSFVPCNDLWEFNLESGQWKLLHDGAGWETDPSIPRPRFSHKMATVGLLKFVNKRDHFGFLITGGKDADSRPLYDNHTFDLVEKRYVGTVDLVLPQVAADLRHCDALENIENVSDDGCVGVDYANGIILSFLEEVEHHRVHKVSHKDLDVAQNVTSHSSTIEEELLVVYGPSKRKSQYQDSSPLLSFRIGKSVKPARVLPLHRKRPGPRDTKRSANHTIPFNLRYPTGGLFGQNIVIVGFLPNDFDISIFIYNKPTGKWLRLNIFCNHDYGLHRFWGGYVWQSHHKVVLLGNYVTSRTTSSIRYFTSMITVLLPITNILASSELAGHVHDVRRSFTSHESKPELETEGDDGPLSSASSTDPFSETDSEDAERPKLGRKTSRRVSGPEKPGPSISFSEYVHYAAPRANFTKIRSVFPPAAITLGRNAFDRYGDLISDFELISCNGDRVPVSMMFLMERWGRYFIELLARGYVQAIAKFENDQRSGKGANDNKNSLSTSISSGGSRHRVGSKLQTSSATGGGSDASLRLEKADEKPEKQTFHISLPIPANKTAAKDAPQFRLPFQETTKDDEAKSDASSLNTDGRPILQSGPSAVDPHTSHLQPNAPASRKNSILSFSSNNSLLNSHLQDLPPQLPLPNENIPAVPGTPLSFRSSSRKNSSDLLSPRASLIHTLTTLRNIPLTKSPRDSPFTSPRASISTQGQQQPLAGDLASTNTPNLKHGSVSRAFTLMTSNDLSSSTSSGESDSAFGLKMDSPIPSIDKKLSSSPQPKKATPYSSMTSVESPYNDSEKKYSSVSSDNTSNSLASKEEDDHHDYTDEHAEDATTYNETSSGLFNNALLNFENIESGKFRMEPSLIPRKLYMPFNTSTLKSFAEYLYTGQVGNKWTLHPTTLDTLAIAKFFKIPLLYDLISEVLFGIIGRKETHVIREGKKLKTRYLELMRLTNSPVHASFKFPLDEYEGFMDTVDDGYLDLALLKKSSNIHKNSTASAISGSLGGVFRKKRSVTSSGSVRPSLASAGETEVTENEDIEEHDTLEEANIASDASMETKKALDERSDDKVEKATTDDVSHGRASKKTDEKQTSFNEKENGSVVFEKDAISQGQKDAISQGENQPTISYPQQTLGKFSPVEEQPNPFESSTLTGSRSKDAPPLKEQKTDSTDDSSDKKTTSTEEEIDFDLAFLDLHEKSNPSIGTRTKSVFDRNDRGSSAGFHTVFDDENDGKDADNEEDIKEKVLTLTLEALVHPEASPPPDHIIDLIYETSAITTDMKLMLRAANARQMSRILAQSKVDLGFAIDRLAAKYEEQQLRENQLFNESKGRVPQQASTSPFTASHSRPHGTPIVTPSAEVIRPDPGRSATDMGASPAPSMSAILSHVAPVSLRGLKPSHSSSSLTNLGTHKLEKTRSNTGFRGIGGFTPFKQNKTDPKLNKKPTIENNRELDRRITKLIKKDEKIKLKNAKDEKLKKQHDEKASKKESSSKTSKPPRLVKSWTSRPALSRGGSGYGEDDQDDAQSVAGSLFSENAAKSAAQPHLGHHHGIFRHLGHKLKSRDHSHSGGEESLIDSIARLSRTQSTASFNSLGSKASETSMLTKKKKAGLFGLKKSAS